VLRTVEDELVLTLERLPLSKMKKPPIHHPILN
jgi:hypothetical protein